MQHRARRSGRSAARSRACRGTARAAGSRPSAKRGAPMSTVKRRRADARHRAGDRPWSRGAGRPRGRARHDRIAHHRPGDAARAVAAGGRFRAVGVVDAQVGVGAGRDADRAAPSAGRSASRGSAAMARASVGADRRESVPRRSSITISLPRPFIFRKRRFASALTAGSDVVLEEGVDFAAIWAESTAFASHVASRLGNRPMVETPGPEPDSRLSR